MISFKFRFLFGFTVLSVFLVAGLWQISPERILAQKTDVKLAARENAYRENNFGVARMEQFDHKEAVEAFRRALAIDPELKLAQINLAIALFNVQDIEGSLQAAQIAAEKSPKLPQPQYLLGLIAKTQNRTEDAIKNFEKVLAIDPGDVGTNVNLGQIQIQQRNYEAAAVFLRRAVENEPYNSTAVYNLATTLLRTEKREEGQQLMKRFQELRQSGAATSIGQSYLEQGRYAEAIVSTGAEDELVDKSMPKLKFVETETGLPPLPNSAAVLTDFDNDGDLDLIRANAEQFEIFENKAGKFIKTSSDAKNLAIDAKSTVSGIIAGDYDNDLYDDLLIFGNSFSRLLKNDGKGGFSDVTAAAKIEQKSGNPATAAFLDADHDGDLDIFLGGAGTGAPNRLIRNNGDGTFLDISKTAAIDLAYNAKAVIATDFDNRRDIDLIVVNSDAPPNVFRNLRDGSFRDSAKETGLDAAGKFSGAAAADVNKDGFTDLFLANEKGDGTFAISDGRGGFRIEKAPEGTQNSSLAQFFDYDNDGLIDLLVMTKTGLAVSRNLGTSWAATDRSVFSGETIKEGKILLSDLDSDGDIDILSFSKNGEARFLRNDGGSSNRSEIVALKGRVSNRSGIGAKVDLRSGSLAQKLESYSSSPMPAPTDLHFGLGKREKADAVRVIWTSGVVQAEVQFQKPVDAFAVIQIEELDRKPSSCPYLYTWNGSEFEFVTDFLGGGEMGNWKSPGDYHYPDSDEFIRITSDQLKPKHGKYEIRITNELEEVLFLDKVKLVAVEHDESSEIYPNEGLGIPSAGKQMVYTTKNERPPLAAVNEFGQSVLEKIEKIDRNFFDDFESLNIRGYANPHSLTLTLDEKPGFNGKTLLLLTGWTDYAFSSDNLAASQSGKSQFLPYLQVKNKKGEWETVIESIGISIGRPQTLVVDLTGKFLSDSREVRIVTNFKTYWDKVAVDSSSEVGIKKTELAPLNADLRERGFSRESVVNKMIVPDYAKVVDDGRWKYFSGKFTRTGDILPLLNTIDDLFVISKTGDEIILSFEALPEPKASKKYTFLLYVDGYSKEMDINSGSPDVVFPLPFKGMSRYPYGTNEKYPMTDDKLKIYDEYLTRTVKATLPRLEASIPR